MRVLLTTDTIGGVWTFTKELTTGLLQQGHSVALVSFGRTPSQERLEWASCLREAHGAQFRFDCSTGPLEWMPSNELAYSAGEGLLLRVAWEFSPDILHSNQFCFGSLPLSVPIVITAHSDVLSWAAACRPAGLESSAWLTHYRNLVQCGLDCADAVVAPTQWMLHALADRFRISCATHAILNGRNVPAIDESPERKLQAVSAGRLWDEAKNLAVLSKIDSPFPFFIVGEERQEGSSAAHLPSNVARLGKLSEADLLALFHRSSIYLATSIYEPFGLAPLEAALCGCAVVANDIPSLREVWCDAALYFSSSDGLSKILAELAGSPTLLKRVQQNCNARALQFPAVRMAESYLAVYSRLLGIGKQTAAREPVAYA